MKGWTPVVGQRWRALSNCDKTLEWIFEVVAVRKVGRKTFVLANKIDVDAGEFLIAGTSAMWFGSDGVEIESVFEPFRLIEPIHRRKK